jgi:hypothetical protein
MNKPLTVIAAVAMLAGAHASAPAAPGFDAGGTAYEALVPPPDDAIAHHRAGHENCGHCQGNQGR